MAIPARHNLEPPYLSYVIQYLICIETNRVGDKGTDNNFSFFMLDVQ